MHPDKIFKIEADVTRNGSGANQAPVQISREHRLCILHTTLPWAVLGNITASAACTKSWWEAHRVYILRKAQAATRCRVVRLSVQSALYDKMFSELF